MGLDVARARGRCSLRRRYALGGGLILDVATRSRVSRAGALAPSPRTRWDKGGRFLRRQTELVDVSVSLCLSLVLSLLVSPTIYIFSSEGSLQNSLQNAVLQYIRLTGFHLFRGVSSAMAGTVAAQP